MPKWEIYCTRWGLGSSSPLRDLAIQTTDIFIRGCYLKYPDFLSQDICFWLGLKSAISWHSWAHQAGSVKAGLRIYLGTLELYVPLLFGGGKIVARRLTCGEKKRPLKEEILRVDCGAGSCWWTVIVWWIFLVKPLWKSVEDGLTGTKRQVCR